MEPSSENRRSSVQTSNYCRSYPGGAAYTDSTCTHCLERESSPATLCSLDQRRLRGFACRILLYPRSRFSYLGFRSHKNFNLHVADRAEFVSRCHPQLAYEKIEALYLILRGSCALNRERYNKSFEDQREAPRDSEHVCQSPER